MRRTTIRRCVAGLVTAVLGATFLAVLAPPAHALTSESGTVELTATSAPDVLRGTNEEQPAASLHFASDDDSDLQLVNSERIIVEVSDGLGENCDGTGKFIGFDHVPTVSLSGANVSVNVTLASSTPANALRSSGTGCVSPFTPTTRDQVIITVTNAPNSGGTATAINLTDISYFVGSQAAVGDVTILWAADVPPTDADVQPAGTGDTTPTSGDANAYITNLSVDNGRSGNISVGSNRDFGTLTITESNFDSTTPDTEGNGVCVNLLSPFRMTFVDAGGVDVTSGEDVVGTPTIENSAHTIRFSVTSSDPATKSTYRWSGIRVNATTSGAQDVNVTQCDSDGNELPITAASENNPDVTVYTDNVGQTTAAPQPTAVRFDGDNRNATASEIALANFDCSGADPTWAIVARNDDFADALAANYPAGQLHAPILLVGSHGGLPPETVQALHDLGVTDVIIMGGSGAVGDDVAAALDALTAFNCNGSSRGTTLSVSRIEGTDRFGTAAVAASFLAGAHQIGTLDTGGGDGAQKTAVLANGRNFPDAMVAGPLAYQGSTCEDTTSGTNCDGFPLVLSDGASSTLPAATQFFLSTHGVTQVIVVGGTGAVPAAITTALTAAGVDVIRLEGATRQQTAIVVAQFEYHELQFGIVDVGAIAPVGSIALARGDFFTDALALGPLAGTIGEPILLTVDPGTVGADTDAFLGTVAASYNGASGGSNGGLGFSVDTIHVAGSTSAVTSTAVSEALDALS